MCLGTSRTRRRAFTFTASECSFPFGACVWKAWGFSSPLVSERAATTPGPLRSWLVLPKGERERCGSPGSRALVFPGAARAPGSARCVFPNWIFGPVLFSLCFLVSIFSGGASNKGRSLIDLFLLLLLSWFCPSPWLGLSTTPQCILLHAFVVDHTQIHVLHSTAIPTTMSLIFLGCSTVSIALPFRKGTLDPTRFGSKGDRNGFERRPGWVRHGHSCDERRRWRHASSSRASWRWRRCFAPKRTTWMDRTRARRTWKSRPRTDAPRSSPRSCETPCDVAESTRPWSKRVEARVGKTPKTHSSD